jgi:RNA polymerase sigma-70 factor, ECF subfamily
LGGRDEESRPLYFWFADHKVGAILPPEKVSCRLQFCNFLYLQCVLLDESGAAFQVDEVGDESLMRQFVASRSSEVFDMLVARHRDDVVRYTARMLGSFHRGEEMAQEAFLRIFQHAEQFDARQNFRIWLFSIAGNLCRNELRRQNPIAMARVPERQVPLPTSIGSISDIQRAMRLLSTDEQQALLLRECHGFSYEEIAAAMQAPLNSVRSWIRRGRMRLAEALRAREQTGKLKR